MCSNHLELEGDFGSSPRFALWQLPLFLQFSTKREVAAPGKKSGSEGLVAKAMVKQSSVCPSLHSNTFQFDDLMLGALPCAGNGKAGIDASVLLRNSGRKQTVETDNDIERQIKELERDKRVEEIRQLRESAKTRWITPTALALLLPLLATFGVWIVGELKQYSKAYQALEQRDALKEEKDALQSQKDSLNLEILTLLGQKEHYANEAQRLQRETAAKQDVIEKKQDVLDKTYLRGVF